MRPPDPVLVLDVFPEERTALLDVLDSLSEEDWGRLTVCEGWSVKDVAGHILGVDLGNLALRRDSHTWDATVPGEDLATFVNRFNDEWVRAARRLSPRMLCDLLRVSGPQLLEYFESLDLSKLGGPVSWAGPEPAPVWLDVAREYTERWVHQQQIRDAVGKPGLTERRFLAPVLATFVHALPFAFRGVDAEPGTSVHVQILGESGGDWMVRLEEGRWTLYVGAPTDPACRVTLDQSVAWRLYTRGISPQEAEQQATLEGMRRLVEPVLHALAIIA